jgi:hypothetical protein
MDDIVDLYQSAFCVGMFMVFMFESLNGVGADKDLREIVDFAEKEFGFGRDKMNEVAVFFQKIVAENRKEIFDFGFGFE